VERKKKKNKKKQGQIFTFGRVCVQHVAANFHVCPFSGPRDNTAQKKSKSRD
jgi:hypothetical protein